MILWELTTLVTHHQGSPVPAGAVSPTGAENLQLWNRRLYCPLFSWASVMHISSVPLLHRENCFGKERGAYPTCSLSLSPLLLEKAGWSRGTASRDHTESFHALLSVTNVFDSTHLELP